MGERGGKGGREWERLSHICIGVQQCSMQAWMQIYLWVVLFPGCMVGKLGREGVLTCSQNTGTTVVFQLGDPPHPESWRLQYPVCACVYTHVCISVTYSTSNINPQGLSSKNLGDEAHSTTIFTWCTCSSVLLSVRSSTPDRLLRNCTEIQ